jgi:hypothetical protein
MGGGVVATTLWDYMRDGELVDVYNVTRDHFYGSWDDEEGSENVIIDASINIKVNHIENHEKEHWMRFRA